MVTAEDDSPASADDIHGHEFDLTAPEAIRQVYETTYERRMQSDKNWQQWYSEHVHILEDVRNASADQLAGSELQERLWEDNPVSSSGACSISTKEVVADQELGRWLAEKAKAPLPDGEERIIALEAVYDELCKRVLRHTRTRTPWLKILRVMATLFPADFSNVVTKYMLRRVGMAMFGKLSKEERNSPARLNARILRRLEEVLGPTDGSPAELARRAEFVWCLWESISSPTGDNPEAPLIFLDDDRRLKGIGVIQDPWNTILDIVEFVSQNRPTRAATVDFILERSPNLKRASAAQYLSRAWNTFGLLRLVEGEVMELTKGGQTLLETEDPNVLIRPFVTKSIGPDLILWELSHSQTMAKDELVESLQSHYSGWTTSRMPTSLLTYGQAFDLWTRTEEGRYALTSRGQKWAARIPEKPHKVTPGTDGGDRPPPPGEEFVPPDLKEILKAFSERPLVFPEAVVKRLHAALHASEGKHFVLLSGLSGTGKTQIALTYADAYHRIGPGQANPYALLVAVQPDWTDPTGLLGYVNPLSEEPSYVSTMCLRFLMKAHASPKVPHFLCLDEMNLARVEHYFAPFLSAMETGGRLVFHQEEDNVDDVPPSIPWPRNLFIFGTVNMDETTHAFSDKVLDRAFTIEFWDVDLSEFEKRFAANKANGGYPEELRGYTIGALKEVSEILRGTHQHFGYRTALEVLGFMQATNEQLPRKEALDHAVFMKVLPKLRGQDTDAMRNVLQRMQRWTAARNLPASEAKLTAMIDELSSTGTTRFWR